MFEMPTIDAGSPFGISVEAIILVVKADRQEPLVIVRLSLAAEIAKQQVAG